MKTSRTKPEHLKAIEPAAIPARTGTPPSGPRDAWSLACTAPATRLAVVLAFGVALLAAAENSIARAAQHTLPLFPAAGQSQQGLARIINHSDHSGTVVIYATDDAGQQSGPVTLSLSARQTRHFDSRDLESGNASKGLTGSLGDGTGDWRLELTSDLDIEPSAYVHATDGFLTPMHDVARTIEVGTDTVHRVPFFNPGSNGNEVSWLRLANLTDGSVDVTIRGRDDAGSPPPGGEVRLTLPAGGARSISAQQIESGDEGLTGRFGDGTGRWRLSITATGAIEVVGLLQASAGHAVNLSASGAALTTPSGGHVLPLFPAAGQSRQGLARIINHSEQAGTVAIHATDDAGQRRGPVTLSLSARQTRHFDSRDLETGNAPKGLTGSLGDGTGDWRLELTSDLDLEPSAYVRTADGVLVPMHDVVRTVEAGSDTVHRVPIFNPAGDADHASLLRLVNLTEAGVDVTIRGRDDAGASSPGGEVRLTLPAGGARRISAQQLESGDDGLTGRLGDGTGRWQLFVTASGAIEVMSLLQTSAGQVVNVSATPHAAEPDAADFTTESDLTVAGIKSGETNPANPGPNLGDFNGDGKDDVLLRHARGNWLYYPMNGRLHIRAQRGAANLTTNLDWRIAGIGDFNGDGKDDVLLRHVKGSWHYYPMNGRFHIRAQRGPANLTTNLDWRVAGIGDFNGDGKDDVLLRHARGSWLYYPMNGRLHIRAQRGAANLTTNLDWRIAGIGDFNGDGKDDVLLRHVKGSWHYYPMNGRFHIRAQRGSANLTTNLDWRIAGIGDFNGDGRDDVMLRHARGNWLYYPMNGRLHIRAQRGAANLTTNLDWRVAGIGDLNGDRRDDVLLRHASGSWHYYPMNGRFHIRAQRGTANLTTNLQWSGSGLGGGHSVGFGQTTIAVPEGRSATGYRITSTPEAPDVSAFRKAPDVSAFRKAPDMSGFPQPPDVSGLDGCRGNRDSQGNRHGLWVCAYSSGAIDFYTYSAGTLHGPAGGYDADGRPSGGWGNYEDGNKSGLWFNFYSSGDINFYTYSAGTLHGPAGGYDADGRPSGGWGNYEDGNKSGLWFNFYSSGDINFYTYSAGTLHGPAGGYDADGRPSGGWGNYEDGNKSGLWFNFYSSGDINFYTYSAGTLHGPAGGYDADGRPSGGWGNYEDGNKSGLWFNFYSSGDINFYTYSAGTLHGPAGGYDADGRPSGGWGNYEDGNKSGLWFNFYSSGDINFYTYSAGTLHGPSGSYNRDGERHGDFGSYTNGRKTGTWTYYRNGERESTTEY